MCEAMEIYVPKYQQLLLELKTTVEGLLVSQVANVWSIYGGLNRLHCCMEKIFKHGCVESRQSYFTFIQGLEWLQPETSKSCISLDCEFKPHLPQNLKTNRCSIWLYRSLENHSLSQKLAWLLSDTSHLAVCYRKFAFLSQRAYAEATLICLRAVERNQASLMSDIDPCLFLTRATRLHRRCSSFPDSHLSYRETVVRKSVDSSSRKIMGKLRPWHSMPCLYSSTRRIGVVSKTNPSTPVNRKRSLRVPHKPKNVVVKKTSRRRVNLNLSAINDIVEHTPPLSSSQSSGSVTVTDNLQNLSTRSMPADCRRNGKPKPSNSSLKLSYSPRLNFLSDLPQSGEKDFLKVPRKSFFEDGGSSVLPMATGYFPKPQKGQTLASFLKSGQFARANAELDRENAHFSISEAIIAAMEQIRCKKDCKLSSDVDDSDDPEIMDLKQRIRLRRREKIMQTHNTRPPWNETMTSDGITDTTVSPCSTPSSSPTTSDIDHPTSDDEDVDDLFVDDHVLSPALTEESHRLSASMASLYSEADVLKRPRGAPDGAPDAFSSAEGVALALISKFSEKQLPRASDLEWLVSEEEAPQALLPLPKSWPVEAVTALRGTNEWAPPRPQIIFTVHPTPVRKVLMMKQNYTCAGCGMKVAPQYASRFRYCDYLGRYFCTWCHTNQVARIPGRVLQKWDFKEYPVSTFSYRLLDQMFSDPLFRVFELNKTICKMSKNLDFCRRNRLGLFYLREYISACRLAEPIATMLQSEKAYLLAEPEVYSMEDLVDVRSGSMKKRLQELVDICLRHTSECKLCLARGFICEICKKDELLFPWQSRKVRRCTNCGGCYHQQCWKSESCKKCLRISQRRESYNSNTPTTTK